MFCFNDIVILLLLKVSAFATKKCCQPGSHNSSKIRTYKIRFQNNVIQQRKEKIEKTIITIIYYLQNKNITC